MENKNQLAGRGLKKIFVAQILTIITAVVALITAATTVGALSNLSSDGSTGALLTAGGMTLVMGILGIVAFIITLVGLWQAGKAHAMYMTAFVVTLIGIGLSIAGNFMDTGVVFEIGSRLVDFIIVFLVCTASVHLLKGTGHDKLAGLGNTVRTLYLIAFLILTACDVLSAAVLSQYAAVIMIVYAIVVILSALLYMIFVGKAAKALRKA